MGWAALGWLAGCALQLRQPALWPLQAYGALCLLGVVGVALSWRRRWWPLLPAAALAFGVVGLRASVRLAEALPPALEGRDLELVGVVAQMPRVGPDAVRFVFEVESAHAGAEAVAVPALVSLGWYGGFDMDSWLDGPARELKAGQRWRLTARLKQPHGSMNPDGYDLELWLFEQGLRAGGYVRSNARAPAQLLAEGVAHPFERFRQRVRDAIVARVPDPTAAGVLAALAVGDQAAIDREDWDLFRVTGIAHLMSISGLHVTMFAWLAGALVGRLWRLHPGLMLTLPAQAAARWGGLLAAAAYALVAGWGVPAQRTVWMIATVVLLRTSGRRWPLLAVLGAAAVVVTAIDPWAMLQPGFWLSFVAVAMLAASEGATPPPEAEGRWPRLRAMLGAGLRTQAVASVGLAPLSMVFFQQVSIAGLVANLFAIPLVTFVVTPLALLGVLLPPLWTLDAAVVQGLMAALRALAALPLAVWTAAAAPAWAMAAGLLGGALLVLPLPWARRLLGLPLLLPLLAPAVERPPPGRFEVLAADIGQGTAVLVRTANHLLVYDAGPQYSPEADAGQRVLLPLLRTRGESKIDLLMLSHRDSDHVGGAASLLAAARVQALSSSLEPQHRLRAGPQPHQRCAAGQSWDWDGVHFEVLHPTEADYASATKPNALSCVLQVSGTDTRLLLTGDIEAPQEAALLARGAPLASDVLLVPHHGSRTSSTPAFVDAVAPRVAVVQAAYRSRFGHPAPDVVARYAERGVEVVRSDRCGAWTLPPSGLAGPAVCERVAARRYWHHPVAATSP